MLAIAAMTKVAIQRPILPSGRAALTATQARQETKDMISQKYGGGALGHFSQVGKGLRSNFKPQTAPRPAGQGAGLLAASGGRPQPALASPSTPAAMAGRKRSRRVPFSSKQKGRAASKPPSPAPSPVKAQPKTPAAAVASARKDAPAKVKVSKEEKARRFAKVKADKEMRLARQAPKTPTAPAPAPAPATGGTAKAKDVVESASKPGRAERVLNYAKGNKGKVGLGVAGALAAGYGAKKLYDRHKASKEEQTKAAALIMLDRGLIDEDDYLDMVEAGYFG